jgi:NADH-quinone oxidoreductase subunit M
MPELTQGLKNLPYAPWFQADSWWSPQVVIFLLLFAGFAIKVPMFPFHTWLPLAHVEAPTAGSILLAGVMLKVGGYGLYRFNLGMTPLGAQFLFPVLGTLAVIGIIYGALAALAQSDVKKLVAYSSVSHMGFIVLGLFALNQTGIEGGLIQMLNHGITTGALFACVGVIYERYHTREMSELGGLWNWSPVWAFFIVLASLGSAAVPFLNGFVGEFPILLGAFEASRRMGAVAAVGMVLGAFYLLWMLQRVVFGPLREPAIHGHDHAHDAAAEAHEHNGHNGHAAAHATAPPLRWHEVAGLTPLMILIVVIGVFPKPFLDPIRSSAAVVQQVIVSEQAKAAIPIEERIPIVPTSSAPPALPYNGPRVPLQRGAGPPR